MVSIQAKELSHNTFKSINFTVWPKTLSTKLLRSLVTRSDPDIIVLVTTIVELGIQDKPKSELLALRVLTSKEITITLYWPEFVLNKPISSRN